MKNRSHSAYAATQVETSVSSARPVDLVVMVYQRLLDHLQTGKIQLSEGADATESLTKSIDLITTGLESCLDLEKGGEIAQNLALIYKWASQEIVRARLHRDPYKIQSVINAFIPLTEAWREHAGIMDNSFSTNYLSFDVMVSKSNSEVNSKAFV